MVLMGHSDYPVVEPLVTDVLAQSIQTEMKALGKLPKAFPTWFRHSDGGKCGWYLWFEHNDFEPSNPPDLSSAFVMWLGTMLHKELQRALSERFDEVSIEVKVRHGDLSSGHCDAVIDLVIDGQKMRIVYELKTRGSWGFDKAVGWERKNWKVTIPQGPSSGDRIQGALNATAVDADLLVIGIIGMESASKGFAERNGISEIGRTVAEWHYEKAEFSPWAEAELERLGEIQARLEENVIMPDRSCVGDEMVIEKLNPNLASPPWQCQYCRHFDNCKRGAAGT